MIYKYTRKVHSKIIRGGSRNVEGVGGGGDIVWVHIYAWKYQTGCVQVQIVILVPRLNDLRMRPWERSSLGRASLTGCALCMCKSTILVLLCTKLLWHNYSIILMMALALRPKGLILKNWFKFCVDDKSLMVVTRNNSYNYVTVQTWVAPNDILCEVWKC